MTASRQPRPQRRVRVFGCCLPIPLGIGLLSATTEDMRAHCKPLIVDYKAPRSIELAHESPLSPAGKVLKQQLRTPYRNDMDRQVD
jgi:acyl-CoA synthetase (AMP-forming)/AMP-acid ligase II